MTVLVKAKGYTKIKTKLAYFRILKISKICVSGDLNKICENYKKNSEFNEM